MDTSTGKPYIPKEFSRQIRLHLISNYLELGDFPLMLLIVGAPGMGKTFQLATELGLLGVEAFSVRSVDLEDMYAGVPAQKVEKAYRDASKCMEDGVPAALVIHDIDTTLGEWKDSASTVNHQNILSVFMHLCDNPHEVAERACKRVPIFLTGNYVERLYKPLVREGRAHCFTWDPSMEERAHVVRSIFSLDDSAVSARLSMGLVTAYAEKPISFFSEYVASRESESLLQYAYRSSLTYLLTNEEYFRMVRMKALGGRLCNGADWACDLLARSYRDGNTTSEGTK